MGKGRRNQRNPDYHKVQGGATEDRDAGRVSRQKLSGQRRTARKAAETRKPARPRARREVEMPDTLAGAALSRLGGLGRRLVSAAGTGLQALRWAGHMVEVARGKKREQ